MSDKDAETGGGPPPGSGRTALAEQRTALALQRTRFAADRTLMAWVRTSLALISFGFTFVKFFQYLGKVAPAGAPWGAHGPRNVGLALVSVGTIMVMMAAVQNYQLRKRLGEPGKAGARVPGALVVAGFIAAIGVLALVELLFRAGIF